MMIQLPKKYKVFFCTQPIDMRKAIDGLCVMVSDVLAINPQDKALTIFYNKSRDKLKALVWDNNGFVMIYKRLEKGRFKIPRNISSNTITITQQELRWLMAGLDFTTLSRNPALMFSDYC